jgi:hypothetical protein
MWKLAGGHAVIATTAALVLLVHGCSRKAEMLERPETASKTTWPNPGQRGFKVFQCDYRTGATVESNDAKSSDLRQIEHMMREILTAPRNYVGLTDQFDVSLQFMVNDDGSIHIDRPMPKQKGSMTKRTTLEESVRLVQNLGPSLAECDIPGFVFEAW